MRITLYRYIGDSDTANKLLKQCTVIYDKEVVPYGAFNPNGASFRLDTLHDVNYAKFTYNSHDYYGYVDVKTDSKGIYNYTITTDPLTTAWYAGCFNVGNKCLYSDLGSNDNLQDTRVAYSHGAITEYIGYYEANGYRNRPAGGFRGNWVVMVVLNPNYNVLNYDDLGHNYTQNPAFNVYIMYDKAFEAIMNYYQTKLSDKEQTAYSGCIIKLYTIDNSMGWYLTKDLKPRKNIDLYTVNATIKDVAHQLTLNIDNFWIYDVEGGTVTYSPFGGIDNLIDGLNATNFQDSILLNVSDCGNISIRGTDIIKTIKHYTDVEGGTNSYTLSFNRYFDFVGGQQSVIPCINSYTETSTGTDVVSWELYQYKVTCPIPSSFPFMFDSSITNWYSVVASTTLGIMSTVANTVAQNYVSAAASAVSTIGNLAGNIQEAKYGTASISGSTGGSLSNVEQIGDTLYWVHRTPTNLADIQGKFGKPDGLVRVIGNMTGWVQTEACHLPSNGLPFDIVTQAEQLSNQGFRIVV